MNHIRCPIYQTKPQTSLFITAKKVFKKIHLLKSYSKNKSGKILETPCNSCKNVQILIQSSKYKHIVTTFFSLKTHFFQDIVRYKKSLLKFNFKFSLKEAMEHHNKEKQFKSFQIIFFTLKEFKSSWISCSFLFFVPFLLTIHSKKKKSGMRHR